MLYAFHLLDRPGAGELRAQMRPAHKDHLERVADRTAAMAWLRDEPFTRAGVYAGTQVHAFQNLRAQRVGFPPP